MPKFKQSDGNERWQNRRVALERKVPKNFSAIPTGAKIEHCDGNEHRQRLNKGKLSSARIEIQRFDSCGQNLFLLFVRACVNIIVLRGLGLRLSDVREAVNINIISAIILGVVQGITEFLPVSSSGHLSILQNLFEMQTAEQGHMFFDVLLHLGTLVSICIYYRYDLKEMAIQLPKMFRASTEESPEQRAVSMPPRRLLFMIIIATLPLALVLPIKNQLERLYGSTIFIGAALILTGTMLFVSDKMRPGTKTESNMTVFDALIIGACQAVAVIPGLSRSGTTITAGMAAGLNRETAVKFSFLMSLPAVLGANLLSILDVFKEGLDVKLLPAYLLGTLVAAISGYIAIGLVKFITRSGRFGIFAYYCWFVGIAAIVLTLIV